MRELEGRGLDRARHVSEPRRPRARSSSVPHARPTSSLVEDRSLHGRRASSTPATRRPSGRVRGGQQRRRRRARATEAIMEGARGAASCPSPACTTPRAAMRPASACSTTAASSSRLLRRRWGSRASPTWTSTRTTATACSTRSRTTRTLIFADIHEDGRFLYPGHRRAEEPAAAPPRHQAQHPAAAGRRRRGVRRAWEIASKPPRGFAPGVHPAPVRRRQPRGRPDHAPALLDRGGARARGRPDLAALADRLGHGRVLGLGGGGYNREPRPGLDPKWSPAASSSRPAGAARLTRPKEGPETSSLLAADAPGQPIGPRSAGARPRGLKSPVSLFPEVPDVPPT
jgi:acetoin utilization protein AcuC